MLKPKEEEEGKDEEGFPEGGEKWIKAQEINVDVTLNKDNNVEINKEKTIGGVVLEVTKSRTFFEDQDRLMTAFPMGGLA